MTDGRRITIIDDHPLLATGLEAELGRAGVEVQLLDPAVGPDQLLDTVRVRRPDCVVLDLGLPFPGGGATLIGPLVEQRIRVMVLTGQSELHLWARSLGLGAEVVVSKAEPLVDIVDTILQVAAGHAVRARQRAELMAEHGWITDPFGELSPREQQVLAGLMQGHAAATLAEQHFVSLATIRAQIRSLLTKLGVSSQLEAVALAYQCRWNVGERQA